MVNPDPASGPAAANNAPGEQLLQVLAEVLNELRPGQAARKPTLDDHLDEDLGLDSLARVELTARLERRFGVRLSETLAVDADRPRDLLQALLEAGGAPVPVATAQEVDTRVEAAEAAPDSAATLVEVLRWHVEAHPARAHIQFYDDTAEGEIITYRGLWDGALALAAGLQARGLQPGETVALMLPTGVDYFFSFFAVLLAGATPVPIYPPARRSQIEDHLRRQGATLANAGAAMLITVPEARLVANLLSAQVTHLRAVVTPDELRRDSAAAEVAPTSGDDIGFLQYTSGSTGDPKGVVLTHANLLANIRADGEGLAVSSDDVFVSWLPLYHDMGLIGAWLGSLYHSVRLVILSPLAFLARPQRWLWAVHRYGGTLSAAPNFAYELCLRRIDERDLQGLDLSGWRLALNGAEPISPVTLEGFCERFAGYGFRREAMLPVYGLAECSVGLTFPALAQPGPRVDAIAREVFTTTGVARPAPPGAGDALRFVGCGRPLRGHEIRVVDAGGRELPDRREGRLQFRGPSATAGYYRNPEATRALFDGDWLRTGDLAYIAEGDLFLTGRSKDLIIRGGRNIYPAELEDAIGDVEGVRRGRVAVFASADRGSGTERLVVLAETRAGEDRHPALRRAINALATELAAAPPDEIVLAPPGTVLKTSSGKVRRTACRDLSEQGRVGRRPQPLWLQVLRLTVSGAWPRTRRALGSLSSGAYSAFAWALIGVGGLLAWVGVMMPVPPAWRWTWVRGVLRVLLGATGTAFEVRGAEHLRDGSAVVIVSNHQSYLDAPLLIAALPRPAAFLAKAELAAIAPVRALLTRLGTQFVKRQDTRAGIENTRRVVESLHRGERPLIFAEGTFKRMPGLLPFHLGGFVAAVEAGRPVVPVAIRGSRQVLRADSWRLYHGAITVTVGEPMAPTAGAEPWQAALGLRDRCREHILRHSGEPDLQHESNRLEP